MIEPLSEAEYLSILMLDEKAHRHLPLNLEMLEKRKMTKEELEQGYTPILADGYSLVFMKVLICYNGESIVWV